jgi:hypothetical protein
VTISYRAALFLLAATLVGGLAPAIGHAEECVVFKAIPDNASVTVRASILTSSKSPMTYCSAVPGKEYLLNLYSHGYEDRTLKFSLSQDGRELNLKGNRTPYVLRSAVIPGSGIWAMGRRGRGTWLFTLNALAAYGLVRSYADYDGARDQASRLRVAAGLAPTVPNAEELRSQALAAGLEADAQRTHFIGTATLAGWVYVGNVVEAFLVASPPRVRSVQGSTAVLETPRVSSRRAFWRSLFFPGLGQNYLGNNFRSFLFQTGFIASAVYTIDANLDYDRADNRYQLALIALSEAQTVPEMEDALAQVGFASDDRRDNKTKRDVMFIITGSIWLLSVIDAAFSETPQEPKQTGFGFETSYQRSTLRTGLSLKF